MPYQAYAFDAYGTLFDVAGAVNRHRSAIGPDAAAFAALWRAKQLEYSWTRSLMGRYADFWTLTKLALDFTLLSFPEVPPGLRESLLDAYWQLDAYADVAPALAGLRARGKRLVIFTNGTTAMAEAAAGSAGIAALFESIVSIEKLRRFKTAPEAYGLVCATLDLPRETIALVSSNRWDIAGASAFGMGAIWCNRRGQPDEYADLPPTATIADLSALNETR